MQCNICTRVAQIGADALYSDAEWIAMPSGDRPGWVILAARKHAEWTWGMSAAQAVSFGPAVAHVSEKMRETARAGRVYLIGLGEAAIHCHFLLIPRLEGLANDIRASLRDWGEDIADHNEAVQLADTLRTAIANSAAAKR